MKKADKKEDKRQRDIPYAFPENMKGISPMADPVPDITTYDPPVPNRAWTEMRLGKDIDELSEEEKADLYIGRDNIL
ncbi:MAG: hypothetical protein IJX97_03940 [Clostridia bacterium]|nr:hypothetical protein [Clostridia bacterium]MBQ8720107.1 hypothetical protein [Clostridia bacterium]